MSKHKLKDISIRNAKPENKDYRLSDGNGLYLIVKSDGAKWWRLDYTFDEKRKTISIGVYPRISLSDARRKTEEAHNQIDNGINPSELRKQIKANKKQAKENAILSEKGLPLLNTFTDIAQKWLIFNEHRTSKITNNKKHSRLKRWIFPLLGNIAINQIKSPDIASAIKPLININKLETAKRLCSDISSIFDYAIVHNLCEYDPAKAVSKQIPPQNVTHRAAIIDPSSVGKLLRDIDNYDGTLIVKCAFKISPLVFQRPGEIRQMLWSDIDWGNNEWRPHITKTNFDQIVPLSTQVIAILQEIAPLTGNDKYVFPSSRRDGNPMSENTIRLALKKLGYKSDVMTAHGFRTTASTLLNEQGWSPDAIERQLAHAPRDSIRAVYNRAQYLDERRNMMQAWADYLDKLKNSF